MDVAAMESVTIAREASHLLPRLALDLEDMMINIQTYILRKLLRHVIHMAVMLR